MVDQLPAPIELIIALDFADGAQALKLIEETKEYSPIYKVGSELFLAVGPEWVRARVTEGCRIFLDLKFHDIPNTVAKASVQACDLGVEMFTLHLVGGPKMIEAVKFEMNLWAEKKKTEKLPKVLGVSVLTSFDQPTWDEVSFAVSDKSSKIQDSVKRLVSQARFWGVDGVVCSPHELPIVRELDRFLYTVVPGIRPTGSKADDQARKMTPKKAKALGANAVVVGRPIKEAKSSKAMVEKILKDLR
jgi:orotidine-5'-phosphate decarboxylase